MRSEAERNVSRFRPFSVHHPCNRSPSMIANWFWLFTIAGGAFILGAIMAYVLMRQRPLPPSVKEAQDQRVREFYREDEAQHIPQDRKV